MCVPVQWVRRDFNGNITHIGGSSPRGVIWGLTTTEATALITQRLWEFFVDVAGARAGVLVSNRGGADFLTTSPDGVGANNLDNLPMNPQPVTGVLPEFPLSLPGVGTMSLMRVESASYAAGGKLRPLINQAISPTGTAAKPTVPASFWSQSPRWLYFDVLLPFPCEVLVFEVTNLTRVPGDSPAARRALEAAGQGWWSLDYVLTRPDGTIDPTKPSRVTEARLIVRPPQGDWDRGRVYVSIACLSLNSYCYAGGAPGITSRQGQSVAISMTKPAAPAPPPTPTVTVPNVVGQRLDLALRTLWGAKFRVTVVGPTDVSTNLRVVSQDLVAGTSVKEGSSILLSARSIAPAPGFRSIAITNQSDRAAPVDMWLFDYTTGGWAKETTIAYQDSGQVLFEDGHVYWVVAVDKTKPGCDSGRPDEGPCVYATPERNFNGDDKGLTGSWQIL